MSHRSGIHDLSRALPERALLVGFAPRTGHHLPPLQVLLPGAEVVHLLEDRPPRDLLVVVALHDAALREVPLEVVRVDLDLIDAAPCAQLHDEPVAGVVEVDEAVLAGQQDLGAIRVAGGLPPLVHLLGPAGGQAVPRVAVVRVAPGQGSPAVVREGEVLQPLPRRPEAVHRQLHLPERTEAGNTAVGVVVHADVGRDTRAGAGEEVVAGLLVPGAQRGLRQRLVPVQGLQVLVHLLDIGCRRARAHLPGGAGDARRELQAGAVARQDADGGHVVAREEGRVGLEAVDDPWRAQLDHAPVVAGCAFATALPAVHPLAEVGEEPVLENRRVELEEHLRGRKPLIRREEHPPALVAADQVGQRCEGRRCLASHGGQRHPSCKACT
mmetsp:Transcript_52286/g.147160  ORF Transcript_52286/g.147160 Transcript_52286/m.147160 type:complete len:383 (+) Transcript_52286:173-1321(+)